MSEVMKVAKEHVQALAKEQGCVPEKVSVTLEFDSEVMDYALGDVYVAGVEKFADDPRYSLSVYVYLSQYADVKSNRQKRKEKKINVRKGE